MGQTVNLLSFDFGGSNPSLPTKRGALCAPLFFFIAFWLTAYWAFILLKVNSTLLTLVYGKMRVGVNLVAVSCVLRGVGMAVWFV